MLDYISQITNSLIHKQGMWLLYNKGVKIISLLTLYHPIIMQSLTSEQFFHQLVYGD